MAKLEILKPEEARALTLTQLRKEYNKLAKSVERISNGDEYYCHYCNEFHPASSFYLDKRFASGYYPECKQYLLKQATDYDRKNNRYIDNKKKTIDVFRKLNLPFINSLYESALSNIENDANHKNYKTAYQNMLVVVKAMSQYKGKTFKNSQFGTDYDTYEDAIDENSETYKAAKKRFGSDFYSSKELIWLEDEYQDWITRYECNTKAQEEIFESLSENRLEKKQAIRDGRPTKDIDKTFQELLASQNIQPRQTNSNSFTEAQGFGKLIQKYEETRPLPEIDPELEDVDKIGKYIDVFYKGHTCKMLGIKNNFSHLYERIIKKFSVNKPQYDEESDSEIIFEKLFGSSEE